MVSAFTLRDLLYAAIRHMTMFETEKKKPPLRFATIEAFLFIHTQISCHHYIRLLSGEIRYFARAKEALYK